jgi:hypothetical protein
MSMYSTSAAPQRPRLKPLMAIAIVAFVAALAAAPPATAQGPVGVQVMTRNLYLGADLRPALGATTPEALAQAAEAIFARVQSSNPPARMGLIANEIQAERPILVGLQEAVRWRTGHADGPPVIGGTAAEAVVCDFKQLLLDALASRGLRYRVVVERDAADYEVTGARRDLRVTIRNVILVRDDIPARFLVNARSADFTNNPQIPLLGGLVRVPNTSGWTSVDATLFGRTFRFVNTHLEPFDAVMRSRQAGELRDGPASGASGVMVVGDLNAGPGEEAYTTLTNAGFVDTWTQVNGAVAGPTCCHAENLLDPLPTLTRRIDHVLTRPRATHRRIEARRRQSPLAVRPRRGVYDTRALSR